MSCERLYLGDGKSTAVCFCGWRTPKCQTPGCDGWFVALCDYHVTRKGKPGTCDRRMCAAHRVSQGPNVDYCEAHERERVLRGTKEQCGATNDLGRRCRLPSGHDGWHQPERAAKAVRGAP